MELHGNKLIYFKKFKNKNSTNKHSLKYYFDLMFKRK